MKGCEFTEHMTFEEPSETVAQGRATIVYKQRGTAWCKLEWLGGRMPGSTADSLFRLTTRYRTDIMVLPGWQIGVEGGERKFRVTAAADPDGRRRELVILANEVRLPAKVP